MSMVALPVYCITNTNPGPHLTSLGELTFTGKGEPDPALTARWGYAGQKGVTMPGPGKTPTGTRGHGFLDIHLNATTRCKDMTVEAWNYTLGGYQVLKKWLSYREHPLLHRPLTPTEAEQFTHHTRRIASILALHGKLDSHYWSCS